MDKELKSQVAEVVADLFNEKEEAEIRRKTEVELQKAASSISELTSALELKNTEVSGFEEKLSVSEARNVQLSSELEAAKKELEIATAKYVEIEKVLDTMKKDRATELRMVELEDAGVVRSDKEAQMAKVREMSDEEFASYKEELASIRAAVIAELNKAREKAEADAKAEEAAKQAVEEAAKKAAEEAVKKMGEKPSDDDEDPESDMGKKKKKEKCSAEDGDHIENASGTKVVVAPVEIDPAKSSMAALNIESPNNSMKDKYAQLGKALAERFKNRLDD